MDEFEQQLARWRDLERVALAAEEKLKGLGQLAASPQAAALAREAAQARQAADDYLDAILGMVKNHPPASNDQHGRGRKTD